MIHRKTLAVIDIDFFTNIPFEIIYNMVEYFKTHMCALDFGSLFLIPFVKENKQLNKNHLFIIYNSPSSKYLVIYL